LSEKICLGLKTLTDLNHVNVMPVCVGVCFYYHWKTNE